MQNKVPSDSPQPHLHVLLIDDCFESQGLLLALVVDPDQLLPLDLHPQELLLALVHLPRTLKKDILQVPDLQHQPPHFFGSLQIQSLVYSVSVVAGNGKLLLVLLHCSQQTLVLRGQLYVLLPNLPLKAAHNHRVPAPFSFKQQGQFLDLLPCHILLVVDKSQVAQDMILLAHQPVDLQVIVPSQSSHSLLLLLQVSPQNLIHSVFVVYDFLQSPSLNVEGVLDILQLQVLSVKVSLPFVLEFIKLSQVESLQSLDLPDLIGVEPIQLLLEVGVLLVESVVQPIDLTAQSLDGLPGNVLSLPELLFEVDQPLALQVETSPQVIDGVLPVSHMPLQVIDLRQQLFDPPLKLLFLCLCNHRILLMLHQDPLYLLLILTLKTLYQPPSLILLLPQHLLIHLNLQLQRPLHSLILLRQMPDLLLQQ